MHERIVTHLRSEEKPLSIGPTGLPQHNDMLCQLDLRTFSLEKSHVEPAVKSTLGKSKSY
jgi:hypothetical protein